MRTKQQWLAVVLGTLLLSGCSMLPEAPNISQYIPEAPNVSQYLPEAPDISPREFGTTSPMPFYLRSIPEGQDSFSTGWRDGCNTYLGFTGSGMVQMRGFTYDINRSLNDRQYAAGFREGANLCMYYTDTRPN